MPGVDGLKRAARKARPSPAPTTPDPIEIAMEAEAGDASPDSPARRLLVDQGRLVRWQIASERAGFALKVLTATVGVAVAGVLAAMAWRASRADGLVVEPLLVSSALAEQGLSGPVLARQALDRMAALDAQTGYFRAVRVNGSWSQSAAIPIPHTGLSFEDVDRTLRRWLGRETIVTGEVYIAGGRTSVILRADAGRAVARIGSPDDVAALTQDAAESLFARARPLQYSFGVARRGDLEGARRYAEVALNAATKPADKALAFSAIALTYLQQGRLSEAITNYAEAIRIGPPGYRPYLPHGYSLFNAGRSEEAVRSFAAAAKAPPRPGGDPVSETRFASVAAMTFQMRTGAFRDALRTGADIFGTQIRGFFSPDLRPEQVQILTGLHQTSKAGAVVPRLHEASQDAERRDRFRANARAQIAAASEDWENVLSETQADADATLPPRQGNYIRHLRIIALANLGRTEEARVLAASLPRECDYCRRASAVVWEREGNRAAADRDWAEAVRLAPSVPFANLDWGRAWLARGDAAAAIARFETAHSQQPAFADPLELWGEALLAQGDARGAAAKFAEAAKLAPRWGRLHLKWGEALAKLGKTDEARAKWRAAATMDLSAADRAALKAHGV